MVDLKRIEACEKAINECLVVFEKTSFKEHWALLEALKKFLKEYKDVEYALRDVDISCEVDVTLSNLSIMTSPEDFATLDRYMYCFYEAYENLNRILGYLDILKFRVAHREN